MTTHELKCWPEYYASVVDGSKPFELRKDDRPWVVGDQLFLREWEPTTGEYTGRTTHVTITCIVRGGPWLTSGYCALGLGDASI